MEDSDHIENVFLSVKELQVVLSGLSVTNIYIPPPKMPAKNAQ
jgi:hypothetical protein